MARIKVEAAPQVATANEVATSDPEREAIQAESKDAEQAIRDKQNAALELAKARLAASAAPPPSSPAAMSDALGAGFFGPGAVIAKDPIPEPPRPVPSLSLPALPGVDDPEVGQEVEGTRGEEMYGKPGTFSSYRVGPFTGRTRIRPGETRVLALCRLLKEFAEVAKVERDLRHDECISHFAKVAAKSS